jgi:alkanesulfonate monooxygenase SsuD/methylene tetrahydromethanopterin reductase-like flavin-dependent oxidoreductase (luciferase family)
MTDDSALNGRVCFGLMGSVDVQDAEHSARWGEHSEKVGADLLATGEGASLIPAPYLWLQTAAWASTRLQLGMILTTPELRHPTVLANAVTTLQRISCGRMFLGIGTGDLAWRELGMRASTLTDLKTYATAVQTLTTGVVVDYDCAVR